MIDLQKTGGCGLLWLTRNPMRISGLSGRRESMDLSSHATKHVCPESAAGGGVDGPLFRSRSGFLPRGIHSDSSTLQLLDSSTLNSLASHRSAPTCSDGQVTLSRLVFTLEQFSGIPRQKM